VPPYGGQGIRFQARPALGTVTFTLPYAGAIRIRFEGLPGYCIRLSVRLRRTPLALRDS
jgi:hypothetical protein